MPRWILKALTLEEVLKNLSKKHRFLVFNYSDFGPLGKGVRLEKSLEFTFKHVLNYSINGCLYIKYWVKP